MKKIFSLILIFCSIFFVSCEKHSKEYVALKKEIGNFKKNKPKEYDLESIHKELDFNKQLGKKMKTFIEDKNFECIELLLKEADFAYNYFFNNVCTENNKDIETLNIFIKHGFDPNIPVGYHMSAVMQALKYEYFDIADVLLDHNASLQEPFPAIFFAVKEENPELVRYILSKDNNLSFNDEMGFTVLDRYELDDIDNEEILELLNKNNATHSQKYITKVEKENRLKQDQINETLKYSTIEVSSDLTYVNIITKVQEEESHPAIVPPSIPINTLCYPNEVDGLPVKAIYILTWRKNNEKDIIIPSDCKELYIGIGLGGAINNISFEKKSKLETLTVFQNRDYATRRDFGYGTIKKLSLPKNLKKLVFNAAIRGLEELNLPEGIEEIYLKECTDLTKINIPNSIKTIPDNAFKQCESLKEISIPNSITKIGSYAFQWSGLENIIIPDSVKLIDSGAFDNCKLEKISLPKTDCYIKHHAFSANPISQITNSDQIETITISREAFYNCKNLDVKTQVFLKKHNAL